MSTVEVTTISQAGVWNFDPQDWTSEWSTDDYQWFDDHPSRAFLIRSPFCGEVTGGFPSSKHSVIVHGESLEKILVFNPRGIIIDDDLDDDLVLLDLWREHVAGAVCDLLAGISRRKGDAP